MFKIKKQLSSLYLSSILGNLSLTGAWVAILAARGYSLVEIGIAETVFHIISIIFEIPSGVLADVFGRKKMLIVSTIMRMIANSIMIFSCNLFTVCLSIAFQALAYNFSSGSGDALAYDSLKTVHQEKRFEKYESNQLIIYRLFNGISTLCAGFALFIGHKIAYSTDLVTGVIQLFLLFGLHEIYADNSDKSGKIFRRLVKCFKESFAFLIREKRVMWLMFGNSLIGAADILLLFFLQAKLPEKGISEWSLGAALLFMEMGGIIGSKFILKLPKLKYRKVFLLSALLVVVGLFAEHSSMWFIMTLGGFLSAMGDDALQVRTNAKIQDMLPSEQRATLTSIESFTFSIIMIILSPLAGIVFTVW